MTEIPLPIDEHKRAAAEAAVAEVEDGMLVGLGTGSTATFAVDALARRIREGLRIHAVATSMRTTSHAVQAGISLLELGAVAEIDLCIDGVDEIDPGFRAIKGAGGAMLQEKLVASMARRNIAIADGSKSVARLGARPIPVEILPTAFAFVARQLDTFDCTPRLRRHDAGAAVRTDQGNLILDCQFDRLDDPAGIAAGWCAIPGLLGHGLFLSEIDALYLGTADGVIRTERHANEH